MVTDLFEDIKDGFVMHALLEELSGQSLRPLGKMTKGKLRIQVSSGGLRSRVVPCVVYTRAYTSH
jgi:hypothetical protein